MIPIPEFISFLQDGAFLLSSRPLNTPNKKCANSDKGDLLAGRSMLEIENGSRVGSQDIKTWIINSLGVYYTERRKLNEDE